MVTETFFNKIKTQKYLEDFVRYMDENGVIEYKSFKILSSIEKAKQSLVKEVSALANSEGGLIIIGVDKQTKTLEKGLNTSVNVSWLKEINEKVAYANAIARVFGVSPETPLNELENYEKRLDRK